VLFQNGDLTFNLSGLYPSVRREGGEEESVPDQPEQTTSAQHVNGDEEAEMDHRPAPTTGDADNASLDSGVGAAEQSNQRDPLRNAHYWVLSGSEAVEHRLASNYRRDYLGDVREELIRQIEKTLRDSHSMSTMYKTAHEMLQDWLSNHPAGDTPEFHMVLLNNRQAKEAGIHDPETHPHLTEPAVVAQVANFREENEQVALIWINKKGEPPALSVGSGVMVTGRRGERKTISHTNPNKFPATYPILDPHGDQGWRYGLRLSGVNLRADCSGSSS
jgi:hypothetical protein